MSIPVYLFCGFLDSGKTTFMQETLGDPEFNTGEKTLLLLCEDGEVEFDKEKFAGGNVTILPVEKEEDLTSELLKGYAKKHRVDRVLIEYNGMWPLPTLYDAMPKDWQFYQIITVADSATFPGYLNNMRQLAVDKLRDPEVVLFNRVTPETDKLTLHRAVRMVNRRATILYETVQGEVEEDDIVEPLPFDKTAQEFTVQDEDFGVWYMDIMETPEAYRGKTVHFKAYVCQTKRAPAGSFVAGRFAMTCCAEDITFYGMLCQAQNAAELTHRSWMNVTATIDVTEHAIYEGPGPLLKALSVTPADAPEDELVYFLR